MPHELHELFGDVDLSSSLVHLLTVGIAAVLALPVGWDRERSSRAMGLRTFPLVAVASAGYVLVARSVIGDGSADAHARIIQGLMTGIGFLGGGAILKHDDRVKGTATAASIWSTAAIGAAVAYGRPEVAVLLSAVNFVALRLLKPVKKLVRKNSADDEVSAERTLAPSAHEARSE